MKKLPSKPKRLANKGASGGRSAPTCSAFAVGDRVTMVKSESLPESMEGIPCIVTAVDMATDEEYFRYEVAFRMDHKTPIRMGEDVIANARDQQPMTTTNPDNTPK